MNIQTSLKWKIQERVFPFVVRLICFISIAQWWGGVGFSEGPQTKEYIRLNGRVIAIETTVPAFDLTLNPSNLSVPQGESRTATISVSGLAAGCSGTVSLSVGSFPSGVTATFSPTSVALGQSSTLTLSAAAGAAVGSGSVVVTGTCSTTNTPKTANLNWAVTAASSYTVAPSPATIALVDGQSAQTTVSVSGTGGCTGNVALGVSGLPTGVNGTFAPTNVAIGASSTLTLQGTGSAIAGSTGFQITATCANPSTVKSASATVAVTTYSLSSSVGTIVLPGTTSSQITVVGSGGCSGNVALNAAGLPAGVSATFSPTAVAVGAVSTMTLSATGSAVGGTYPFQVTGACASPAVTKTVAVQVTVPTALVYQSQFTSISAPGSVIQGSPFSSSIVMQNPTGAPLWDLQASAGVNQVQLASQTPAGNGIWGTSVATSAATTVGAGASATFTVNGRAPVAVTGAQTFDWQLRKGSSEYFGAVARPTNGITVVAGTNNSQLVSVSGVPSSIQSGGSFTATVQLRNTGTAVWWSSSVSGTKFFQIKNLEAVGGNEWSIGSVAMAQPYVGPNEIATFTMVLYAPLSAGSKTFRWQMEQTTVGVFGEIVSSTLMVVPNAPQVISFSPVNSIGGSQQFTGEFSGGPQPLLYLSFRFREDNTGNPYCKIFYNVSTNAVLLQGLSQWASGTPGTSQILAVPECSLNLAFVSVISNPGANYVKFIATVGFSAPLLGTSTIYALAQNNSTSTGWVSQGSWNVQSVVSVDITPKNVSMFPGEFKIFNATVSGTAQPGVTFSSTGPGILQSGAPNAATFTAGSVSSSTAATVTATSNVDPSKADTANITIQASSNVVTVTSLTPVNGQNYGSPINLIISANGGSSPLSSVSFRALVESGFGSQWNSGCTITWYPSSGTVTVADTASSNSQSNSLGLVYGQIEAGICTVDLWHSSGTTNGNQGTLSLTMNYTMFAPRTLSLAARATNVAGGSMADWQYFGSWGIL